MTVHQVKRRVARVVNSSFAVLLLVLAVPHGVSAETGQAFSISPPIIELKADPGQTVNASLKLTNVSEGELVMRTEFNDFAAKNETGDPKIIFDDNPNATFSLKNWIVAPAPFNIQSKETKQLSLPIRVPKDAEPGGHYAVIRFTGSAPQTDNGVALSASIGTLVLLQVSGNIKEDASVAEFFSATPQFANAGFFENSPIGFVARIKNSGNVHVKPTGTIEVKNMFGATVGSIRVNGDPSDPKNTPKSILPQSIRRFEQSMPGEPWMIGPYTATLKLSYGQNQKELVSNVTFWVVPYKLIGVAIVVALGLFFAARFALNRYKQNILANAQDTKKSTFKKRK